MRALQSLSAMLIKSALRIQCCGGCENGTYVGAKRPAGNGGCVDDFEADLDRAESAERSGAANNEPHSKGQVGEMHMSTFGGLRDWIRV